MKSHHDRLRSLGFLFALTVLAVAGCGADSSGASDQSAVRFRISLAFDFKPDWAPDLRQKGTSTIDGSLPLTWLRNQPPAESGYDDRTWSTQSDQTIERYEQRSCPGDDATKCAVCVQSYTAPGHDITAGTRIDSRSGDTAVTYAWIYNDPNPGDEQYAHGDCQPVPGYNYPWEGWGPVLISATVAQARASALSVKWAVDPLSDATLDWYTLEIEQLP
jgi:hypothetical protein